MNVFELAASLSLDDSQYTKGLNKASKNANSFGTKLKKSFTTTMKAAGVAIAGAATAVAALTKTAVDAYANYEQLVGGVETLFGTGGKSAKEFADSIGKSVSDAYGEYKHFQRAQNEVLKNADNAYKTAGMSANQYMETVTSFSASLVQSLGGDTLKAAEYADKAIVQMSDNANKMGTSIDLIQNAYMGFAKQNYTMLDNLKLGYGGTKTEMERLITDAEKLDKSFKASRDSNGKLKMSYAEIVDAIQIVQDNMGITGTTAAEAEKTISGSLAMVKASWDNLLVGMASESGNFTAQMDALVESAATALDNIFPVVTRFLTGFGDLMKQVGPIIVDKLPQIIKDVVPSMLDAAVSIVGSLVEALPGILDAVVSVFGGLVDSIRNYVTARWPEVGNTFGLIADAAVRIFNGIVGFLKGVFSGDWEGAWNSLKGIAQGIKWGEIGTTAMKLVKDAWNGLKKWASGLWEKAKEGIQSVNWKQAGTKVKDAVSKAWDTLKSWAKALWLKAKTGIQDVNWGQVGTSVKTAIAKIWDNLKGWATSIWKNARAGVENVDWKTAGDTAKSVIQKAWDGLKEWATRIWGAAKDGIENVSWTQVGSNIWGWIKTPLLNVADWFTKRFNEASSAIENIEWTQLGSNIWGFIKSAFSETISWFFHLFDNSRSSVENSIGWEALGQSILNLITTGLKSIGDVFYGFLNSAMLSIKYDIDWHALGDTLATLIWRGLEAIGDLFLGRGEEGRDAILGINWWRLGWDILVAILDGLGGLAQGMYDHAANGIKEMLGLEPDYRSAGQKAVDAILNDWDRLPTDARRQALRAAQAYVDPNDDDTWAKISAIVGDDLMEGIRPIPGQVSDVAKQSAKNFGGSRNGGGGGADWGGAGRTAGAAVAAGFHDGVYAVLGDLDAIQKKINNMKGKSVTITVDAKAGANAKGRTAQITLWSTAMDRGHIFKRATVFGYENGVPQVAGDAGPEAVVGVNSLDRMIQNSVNRAISSTQAAMVAILSEIRDIIPKGDVVLDTGALVGGIAGEMNGELERLTAWSGGGRAL